MVASAQAVRARRTDVARGVSAARAASRARCCSEMWVSREEVALGRAAMRRWRKEGFVVGLRRRVRGRA